MQSASTDHKLTSSIADADTPAAAADRSAADRCAAVVAAIGPAEHENYDKSFKSINCRCR